MSSGSPAPIIERPDDSYFVVAHFHYTLFPAAFFGGFAGIYYRRPPMAGPHRSHGLAGTAFFVAPVC